MTTEPREPGVPDPATGSARGSTLPAGTGTARGDAVATEVKATSRAAWAPWSLLIVTAVWGASFVLMARMIEEMAVTAVLTWRFAVASLLLIAIRPKAVRVLTPLEWRRAAITGAVLSVGYLLQTFGLETTSPTVSGFITGMFLVFTPLVAWAVTGERVGRTAWMGVGIATFGLALISLRGFSVGTGEMLTLLGALAFAGQIVALSLWAPPDKTYAFAVVQLSVVALISAASMPFEDGAKMPQTAAAWWGVAALALVATAVAFLVQTWAQARMEPTRAAVILTMEPVFAGITGYLTGDEITWRILVGGSLVISAMLLVELGPRRSRDATVPHLEP